MSKNTNRSLGEGKITRMVKKYAYIMDEHLGAVHFPLSASLHIDANCSDLRERFQSDEHVIFTATKQASQNECKYQAVSVVKPRELISCAGRISEVVPNRFCYAECKKYGKVFVPFSARLNMSSKHWLGKGADRSREVTLKIFAQPQINGCSYVAFSITLANADGIVEVKSVGTVDAIYEQVGIIVEFPAQGDVKVFSHVSGFARLPASFRKSWMAKGRHIRYDAIKQQIPSQEKVHWAIRKCSDLGLLFQRVNENPMNPDQLTLEVHAVINRVAPNPPNRCAWLWNDFIGRIYCYPQNYVTGLNVMEVVKCKVVYTGAFDDVPWSAYDIELLGEDDDVRVANGQMLVTKDDWTVTYADRQKISFIGFLESPSMQPAQCFLAWTDLADSDAPPTVGQKCRATVYYQLRKDKQQWRAVLITPLNPNGIPTSNHPVYSGARELIWPEPVEEPVVDSVSSTSINSPGLPPIGTTGFNNLDNIPAPIGTGMRPYNLMAGKLNGITKQESMSNIPTNGHSNGSSQTPSNSMGYPMELEQLSLSAFEGLTFNQLQNDNNHRGSPMGRHGESDNFLQMFSNNGWSTNRGNNLFNPFDPAPNQSPFTTGSSTIEDLPKRREAETQTDAIAEREILRDILRNNECLKTILHHLPNHMERIMNLTGVLR